MTLRELVSKLNDCVIVSEDADVKVVFNLDGRIFHIETVEYNGSVEDFDENIFPAVVLNPR